MDQLQGHQASNSAIPLPIGTSFGPTQYDAAQLNLLTTAGGHGTGLGTNNGQLPTDGEVRLALEVKSKKPLKYRECLKNHAANLGGHATDGCGEFMPSGEDGTLEALRCAACDCHRNFHRREIEGEPSCADCHFTRRDKKRLVSAFLPTPHAPPLALPAAPTNSLMPRPSSSTHMIMALSTGRSESDDQDGALVSPSTSSAMRKRFRTKFTAEQKEKMLEFAEKVGWRMQKEEEQLVQDFCSEVGVRRHVLKVWMHNNKHTMGKKTL